MREDLYYRLNVLYFEVPSLKDRREDIPLLCRRFLSLEKFEQLRPTLQEIMLHFQRYSWPGNVRELQNFCQRLWCYQENALLNTDITKLIKKIAPNMVADISSSKDDLNSLVDAYEVDIIRKAVEVEGSIRKAAKKLGIGKSTIARKLKNQ
jgi:transcriptional regulator with PAS, ATPase and Fis domain